MNRKKNILGVRIIALLLLMIMLVPFHVHANEDIPTTPRASYYLDSYNAYIYPAGLGKIQVWFTVTGVDYMDEIGALTVQIYESTDNENWSWVKTVRHTSQSNMLDLNDYYHSGHIDYQGTIGRYYKAYVCIWAGKNGAGDTRYLWTNIEKATLFAG